MLGNCNTDYRALNPFDHFSIDAYSPQITLNNYNTESLNPYRQILRQLRGNREEEINELFIPCLLELDRVLMDCFTNVDIWVLFN